MSYIVYVGTYTRSASARGKGEGIYAFRLDPTAGALTPLGVTTGIKNPSFLTINTAHSHLYAVNEITDASGRAGGAVSAYAIERSSAALTFLNQQHTHGAGPCYVSLDRTGQWVLVANYRSGNAAILPILADGTLGEASDVVQHQGSSINPRRQEGPHAHSIICDPTNRYVLVCDLGLDKIMVYDLDAGKGRLALRDDLCIASRPGAGPRHMAFHPNGRRLYVANELDSTISVLSFDPASGKMQEQQFLTTLPASFTGENTCAEIQVAPSGKFVYVSNRGHDSIAVFAVDEKTGLLTATGHTSTQGRNPRNFTILPTGELLLAANQDDDIIVSFPLDQKSGQLSPTGHVTATPTPVCVRVMLSALAP